MARVDLRLLRRAGWLGCLLVVAVQGTDPILSLCPEYVRFTPETILKDGITSTNMEVKVAPGTTSVTLETFAIPLVLAGRTGCDVPQTFALHDDGQNGDRVAGDLIFTLEDIHWDTEHVCSWNWGVPSAPFMWSGYEIVAPGTLKVGTVEGVLPVYNFAVNVLDLTDVPRPDPVYRISDDVQISSHVINVRDDERIIDQVFGPDYIPRQSGFVKKLYEVLADSYDFIHFVTADFVMGAEQIGACPGRSPTDIPPTYHPAYCTEAIGGLNFAVHTPASGLGLGMADVRSAYGSERLQSVLMLGKRGGGVHGMAFFHEFMHNWGLGPELMEGTGFHLGQHGHWAQDVDAGGGGFLNACIWKDDGDGHYSFDGNAYPRGRTGSFELYLMGLIPASEVPPIHIADSVSGTCDHGTISGPIRTIPFEDIVAKLGPRSPSYTESQKDFRVAYVVPSVGRLLNPLEMTVYNRMSQYYSGLLTGADGRVRNLYSLTGGRATLVTPVQIQRDTPLFTASRSFFGFFGAAAHRNPSEQPLVLTNAGGGSEEWQLSTGTSWLRINGGTAAIGGSLAGGEETEPAIRIGADLTGLGVGVYDGELQVTHGGETLTIPVQLEVADDPSKDGRFAITAMTNGASFEEGAVAPGSWATVFGSYQPKYEGHTASDGLVTSLGGRRVLMTDSTGQEFEVLLLTGTWNATNLLVPEEIAPGPVHMVVTTESAASAQVDEMDIEVAPVRPGLFSVHSTGEGPAAATYLRVDAQGHRSEGLTVAPQMSNGSIGWLINDPVDLGGEGDLLYLSFYGTGFREAQRVTAATIGGVTVPVYGFSAHSEFEGLDQVVLGPIPRTLEGKEEAEVRVAFDGIATNTVTVSFQ